MAGLLDLFLQDNTVLQQNAHSRRVKGQAGTEDFVGINLVGAAAYLHEEITGTLPYNRSVNDGEFGDSQSPFASFD